MLSQDQNKFYVSTPIYYVNDVPHIGHAYCTIAADILARYHRLIGKQVLFSTGTDEHGQKIEKTALSKNISSQELVDQVAPRFAKLWDTLNIQNDDFVRTTESRHKQTVNEFFKRVYSKGDIYLGHYEGAYCRPCETYWTKTQAENNKCPECNRELETLQEESFFFKLSNYSDQLLQHIGDNPNFILPLSRRNEVINLIKQGLPDLSISRVTCQWGIPVPPEINAQDSQKKHFIYVWFDALINYLTVVGGFSTEQSKTSIFWPADVHLVGKDIVKFHAITWPIMLMAAGLPLPKMIYGHGFLTIDGEKMSKSKGNALAIEPLIEEFGIDPLRYFLMREISFGNDGTMVENNLINRYNADLANDLGNLLSRTLKMTEKFCQGKVPEKPAETNPQDQELITTAQHLPSRVDELFQTLSFTNILETIWQLISTANRYIEETAPWTLAKEGNLIRVQAVLYNLLQSLNIITSLISPFIPETALKMSDQLGINIETDQTLPLQEWGSLPPGQKITKGEGLFPRIS